MLFPGESALVGKATKIESIGQRARTGANALLLAKQWMATSKYA